VLGLRSHYWMLGRVVLCCLACPLPIYIERWLARTLLAISFRIQMLALLRGLGPLHDIRCAHALDIDQFLCWSEFVVILRMVKATEAFASTTPKHKGIVSTFRYIF
jgi:hypothetical protein